METLKKILKIAAIIIAILVVVVLVFYLTGNKEQLHELLGSIWSIIKNIWLWIVGLIGTVVGFGKSIVNALTGSGAKDEIKRENESIKQELQKIREEVRITDDRLKRERDLHERELKILEERISMKDQELISLQLRIDGMKEMGTEEWFNSLPEEKQKEIENKAWEDVQW